jgi:tetratricopeptide (TPR) repeat protein
MRLRPLSVGVVLVFVLAFLVHTQSIHYGFLQYDDRHFVLEPEVVRAPSLHGVGELFTKPVWGSYHPLHILSYVGDSLVWGLGRPQGFHATNVLLFAVCAALVVPVARSFGLSLRAALVAGALFAVHPSHVESVAWVTGRKDVLSGAFVLLALLARRRTGLALGFFLLALAAKTTAAALAPFLLLEAWLAGRLDRRELARLAPFLVLAAAWLLIEASAQSHLGAAKPLRGGSRVEQLRVVLSALAWYPVRFFWPHPLTIHPELGEPADLQALIVLALTIAPVFVSRRYALAAGFFFLALAPVCNLVPLSNEVQDRYLFLPSIAACCVLGALLARRRELGVVAAIAAGFLAFETSSYTRSFKDDLALWRQAVEATPSSCLAHIGRAGAFERAGELASALDEAQKAVACGQSALAYAALSTIQEDAGDIAGARFSLEAAWRQPGAQPSMGAALVWNLVRQGDLPAAKAVLASLEARAPGTASTHRARAFVAQLERDLPRAAEEYHAAAAELAPGEWLNLASIEHSLGRDDEARLAIARALKLDPGVRARIEHDPALGALLPEH